MTKHFMVRVYFSHIFESVQSARCCKLGITGVVLVECQHINYYDLTKGLFIWAVMDTQFSCVIVFTEPLIDSVCFKCTYLNAYWLHSHHTWQNMSLLHILGIWIMRKWTSGNDHNCWDRGSFSNSDKEMINKTIDYKWAGTETCCWLYRFLLSLLSDTVFG